MDLDGFAEPGEWDTLLYAWLEIMRCAARMARNQGAER